MTIIRKFLLMLAFGSLGALKASSSIENIQNMYKRPTLLVQSLRLEHARNDYKAMTALCSCFDKPLPGLIKQLRNDMRSVQYVIRKGDTDLQELYDQLSSLCVYLKKHKIIYKAILAHNGICDRYQHLFDMIDTNDDIIVYIDEHRGLFDLHDSSDDYLNLFLKQIKRASRQISKFEDYIHSDYVDVKMQNYVFKIELIKLRNAILFDKRYKK